MLKNKLVLVTGGGGGIGGACCILCAEEGATVVSSDNNEPPSKEIISKLTGEGHSHFYVDVSKSCSVTQLANDIIAKYKRVPDVVIHCPAIVLQKDGIQGCTENIFDQIMAVNLKGTYLINRTFGLLLKERGQSGSLINMSSVCCHGCPSLPEYAATKAGIIGFSKSLAKEWAPNGIRVNCIKPGRINTAIADSIGAGTGSNLDQLNPIPMQRPGQPIEVAQVAVFLASDRSSYVTSCEYDVHGGQEMVFH